MSWKTSKKQHDIDRAMFLRFDSFDIYLDLLILNSNMTIVISKLGLSFILSYIIVILDRHIILTNLKIKPCLALVFYPTELNECLLIFKRGFVIFYNTVFTLLDTSHTTRTATAQQQALLLMQHR